jgi:hypothetical protein
MADPIQTARIVEAMLPAMSDALRANATGFDGKCYAHGFTGICPQEGGWPGEVDGEFDLEKLAQAALSTAYPMIREEMARLADAKLCVELRNATAAYNLACREIATAIRATELPLAEKERE